MKCLPNAGGMSDQSEKMMIYFDMIRGEYNKFQKDNLDRKERLRKLEASLPKKR